MTSSGTAIANFTISGKLAAGASHSVALKSDGTVWTWGANAGGQLGIGSTDASTHAAPVQVKLNSTTLLTGMSLAGAGASHSLAVRKSDGSVFGWGSDSAGQLGDNSTTTKTYPVQAKTTASGNPVLTGIIDIAGGSTHTLALKTDGTVWTWGSNSSGQLGDGSTTSRKLAAQVKTASSTFLSGVIAIAAADSFCAAVKSDGTVWAWGVNGSGQLGIGSTTTQKYAVQVKLNGGTPLSGIADIACGSAHALALKTDGTVWSWGANTNGQLGNGTTTQAKNPIQVKINSTTFFSGAAALAAGASHTVILKVDGSIYACGLNSSGQLSINSTTQQLYPIQSVSSAGPVLSSIVDLACGANHTLVTKNDGTVSGSGLNSSGQAGYPTTTFNPKAATPISGFLIISGLGDPDSDGLPTWRERELGTNPNNADTDGDGMPDGWEVNHNLNPLVNDASTDPDGDGFTNLQEYQNGTDPHDYFNGANFNLNIFSGDGQMGAPGAWLPLPLVAQVTNTSGVALINAPVTFSLGQNSGGLAPTSGGTPFSSLTLRTDSLGKAAVYYQQPSTADTLSTVNAQSGTVTIGQVSFTESTGSVPPLGLKLWLKADAGITKDANNFVARWADQSSNGYDAVQNSTSSKPLYADSVLNGKPVVHFDGVSDYLSLPNFASGFTQGEVFVVLRSTGTHADVNTLWMMGDDYIWGPEMYPGGDGAIYESFGTRNRKLTGTPSQELDQFHLYNVSSKAGEFVSRINGREHFRTSSNTVFFPTAPILGGGIYSTHRFGGDIAEVIIFNRVLNEQERTCVRLYLNQKYSFVNVPAIPSQLSVQALNSTQVSLSWVNPISNALTFYDVQRRTNAGDWETAATVTNGMNCIDSSVLALTHYTYRVVARNDAGSSAPSAEVSVTTAANGTPLPLADIKLWLKADEGVSRDRANLWTDSSGNQNDAIQVNPSSQPQVVENAINGRPVVHCDGMSEYLSLPNFASGFTQGEVFVVLRSTGTHADVNTLWMMGDDYIWGPEMYPGGDGAIYETFGTRNRKRTGMPSQELDQFHLYNVSSKAGEFVSRINGREHFGTSSNTVFFPTAPILGGGIYSTHRFGGDIAELIIFNRVLSQAERDVVNSYFDTKYGMQDSDGDSLPDWKERQIGTDPYNPDTNSDGIPDGIEYLSGLDPTNMDIDGDGLTNAQELAMGTNPFSADTDGDGVPDRQDAFPLDPTRWQAPVSDPNDHTPPTITLVEPADAVLLP